MKICVFGAGAIGGYMGVKLAQAGADVSLVARGPHLAAMQENGLTLLEEDGAPQTVKVNARENPADLGPQDYVIVTLKAHSVPAVVPRIQPLIGQNTTIVSAVVVFPQNWHRLGRHATCKRRSWKRTMGRLWPRSGFRLRGLSRRRGDTTGHDQTHRGKSF